MASSVDADRCCVKRKGRPPIYWKTLAFAGPGLLLGATPLAFDGHGALAIALVVVALGLFFLPWLLAPYSQVADRLLHPRDEDFERIEHIADRLGSLPVIGVIWRGAERLTGNVGRREAEEYRRWLRENDE